MCRWAAYIGDTVFLEEVVSAPCHSLIAQSQCAHEAKTATNADGFGLAWYGERPEPGCYRDILPAWSDPNLKSLCQQIRSGLFLAHVRASTGGATSRANCHPFVNGRWSFMHNGQIGGFEKVRRALERTLSDPLYDELEGTTDSELLFLLMIELGLAENPHEAVSRAIAHVLQTQREAGISPNLKLTAAFADGETLHGVRYTTHGHAPTLYTRAFGSGYCVVSEPFDEESEGWQAIPPSNFVSVTRNDIAIKPLLTKTDEIALSC